MAVTKKKMTQEIENKFFDDQRKQNGLGSDELADSGSPDGLSYDRSKKGSVDERIKPVMNLINQSEDFYTSSSCSGRIILFTHDIDQTNTVDRELKPVVDGGNRGRKKGCTWLYVTHDTADTDAFLQIWESLEDNLEMNLKMEPCIFHIQCRTVSNAKKLVHSATESGFRNSGMVISGNNKITVAVRSAIGVEVPVKKTKDCNLREFLVYVLSKANEKMLDNWERIEKFTQRFQREFVPEKTDRPQKGKQGTKGAKQIVEENASTLLFYRNMMMSAGILYCLLQQLFGSGYSFWDVFFVLVSAAISIACFQFMNFMAKPKFSETNQLIDSGVDLNMEAGLAEHVKDVIILTSGVQVLSFFSKYFWFLWLLVPLKGLYYAWSKVISPWVFAPAPEQQPGDEKKQRKLDRKFRR